MKRLKKQLLTAFIVFLMAVALTVPAAAAAPATAVNAQADPNFEIYLKLDGIEGESVEKNHVKWIEIADVQFDVSNTSSSAAGSGSGAGKSTLNQFSVTKLRFDSSSIHLFQAALTGQKIKNGQLVFLRHNKDGNAPAPMLTIDLDTVYVSDYQFNNTVETLTLKFKSIKMRYSAIDAKGNLSAPVTGGWDFAQSSVIK